MKSDKSVSVVCCGRFHYHNWAFRALQSRAIVEFVFSHRYSSGYMSMRGVLNLFFKEYIVRASLRFLPDSFFPLMLMLAHAIWGVQCRLLWRRTRVLHVLLHGNCLGLLRHAKKSGTIVIGEAVNTHPENLHRVIESERMRCGLRPKVKMDRHWARLVEELGYCDYLLVPSKVVWESYVARGFDPNRIYIIPFGANIENFKPRDSALDDTSVFKVVCVAQVGARKGVRDLLATWSRLNWRPSDAQLVVIGRIDSEMRILIDQCPRGVSFLGALGRDKVIGHLQSSHVFFLPTLEEGMAISILEAMACGCVPVTTFQSGADSIIQDGVNGYLLESHDVEGFCKSLDRLRCDRELLLEMRSRVLSSVKTGFTWGDYLKKIIGLYENVVADV